MPLPAPADTLMFREAAEAADVIAAQFARDVSGCPEVEIVAVASRQFDTARAFAEADVIVCRAGASTVTEIAAVGAAAIYVPFPSAVDDHQTANARFLVDAGGGWLMQQSALTAQSLAEMLQNMQRATLLERAGKAKKMQKTDATAEVVAACEELAA